MKDPLSVERLTQVRELFEEALAIPAGERSVFLDKTCGGDRDLHGRVSALLVEAESVDSPFEDLVNELIWPTLESLSNDPSRLQSSLADLLGSDSDEKDPLVGKSVSHFEILEPIGRGGMGMVYRAHDRTLDRTVALKFLPPALGSDQPAKDRFIHEAKAASGLNHPNIATVYEIGETEDQQLFIAMGYYPGETLKGKIERGAIPSDAAIDIAIQLATGIKEAHGHGVIHRDIKPGNIMISEEGTVVLLDFGLAKLSYETGYTQVGQMAGTLAYLSPEQARSEAIDQRTDIWSFGVVLYEMLTGKRPFGGENAQSAIRAILEEDPEPPVAPDGEIPEPLKDILGLCLAKDPNHRYQCAEDLLEDLQRVREGLAPKKRGGRATWNRRLRRRRWVMFGGGAIVVAAVAFMARHYLLTESPVMAGALAVPGAGVGQGVQNEGEINLATSRQATGRADGAIEALEAVFRRDPTNAGACSGLGSHFHLSRAEYDQAMLWYRRAHALEPENPIVTKRIAEIYETLGDNGTAAWWIKRTLKIAPEWRLSNNLRLKLHLLSGDVAGALEDFQSDPDSSLDSLDMLLQALLDTGYSEQAVALCRRYYSAYLDIPDSYEESASFRVVDDPFGLGQGKVLEFDPGKTIGDAPDQASGIYSTRPWPDYRQAAYPLPESALITVQNPGPAKATLYFQINRPSIDGRPAEVDTCWGLVSDDKTSDFPLSDFTDYSVQGRYEPDGIMDIRDGGAFADLAEFSLETDVFYELWFVIDHAKNTYDLHIRGGSHFPVQAAVYTGAKYRKKTTEVLDHFLIIALAGHRLTNIEMFDPLYWDDIYIDPDHENLGKPTPASESGWVLIDDFEDGDVSDWLVRLRRSDRILDIANTDTAFLVARSLDANGATDQAARILNAIEAAVDSAWRPEKSQNILSLTRVHALRGEREKTLEKVRALVDSENIGWMRKGLFEGGEFMELRENLEFQDLISKANGILDPQRARLRDMETRGELAPVPPLRQGLVGDAHATFTRVTEGAIVEEMGKFAGADWGDYDNDGYPDVVVSNQTGNKNHLYHNNGNGTFSRVMEGIIATDSGVQLFGPAWADQDNDGDLDLFIATRGSSPNVFYRNAGNGTFTKLTEGEWVNTSVSSEYATWGDFDNDGFVDLYVTTDGPRNSLYHNNGDGTMTSIESTANSINGESHGSGWSDYDGDGDVDIFVGGQSQTQFRNDGNEVFTWITVENGGIPNRDGDTYMDVALASADYDNDGDLDVLHTTSAEVLLYRNDGKDGFVEATDALVPRVSIFGVGAAWGDYDNDGHQDIFVSNFIGNNLLYHNEGDGSFTRIAEGVVVEAGLASASCTWVDYDNDGDLDLFVSNGVDTAEEQPCELYRNDGGTNNWIVLNLVGTVSNRSAIGAKVWAQATIEGREVTQLREINGGGNGHWQEGPRTHFGLGDATAIDSLRIEWPSGHVQEVSDVTVNQFLTITENAAAP